ncbi:MAG: hypothetical protein ACJAT7_002369 [Psychromonas sp.]|uniref:hypothetical protein n=1 Tax=Psychromonas sp. TaxID=1884585 RepID=UPI0039E52CE9
MYEDKITGTQFPEAAGILWKLESLPSKGLSRQFKIISSYFWFGKLADVEQFEGSSHADQSDENE